MPTCGKADPDEHAVINKLAIRRRVGCRSVGGTFYDESCHLAEGTEVARLRRQLFLYITAGSLVPPATSYLQASKWRLQATNSSVRKAQCLCKGVALSGEPGARGVKERTGAETGKRLGTGTGTSDKKENTDGEQDGDGVAAGTGTGTGTGMGTGTGSKTQDENGDGEGSENGKGDSSGDENGDGSENENEDRSGVETGTRTGT